MSDQPNSPEAIEPRELTVIIGELTAAEAAVEALTDKASKADREAATTAVATLEAEMAASETAMLEAAYAEKQRLYDTATTAGVKAALRRDMNDLREALGKPKLIAGSKSTGPRFDDAVLALLKRKGIK